MGCCGSFKVWKYASGGSGLRGPQGPLAQRRMAAKAAASPCSSGLCGVKRATPKPAGEACCDSCAKGGPCEGCGKASGCSCPPRSAAAPRAEVATASKELAAWRHAGPRTVNAPDRGTLDPSLFAATLQGMKWRPDVFVSPRRAGLVEWDATRGEWLLQRRQSTLNTAAVSAGQNWGTANPNRAPFALVWESEADAVRRGEADAIAWLRAVLGDVSALLSDCSGMRDSQAIQLRACRDALVRTLAQAAGGGYSPKAWHKGAGDIGTAPAPDDTTDAWVSYYQDASGSGNPVAPPPGGTLDEQRREWSAYLEALARTGNDPSTAGADLPDALRFDAGIADALSHAQATFDALPPGGGGTGGPSVTPGADPTQTPEQASAAFDRLTPAERIEYAREAAAAAAGERALTQSEITAVTSAANAGFGALNTWLRSNTSTEIAQINANRDIELARINAAGGRTYQNVRTTGGTGAFSQQQQASSSGGAATAIGLGGLLLAAMGAFK